MGGPAVADRTALGAWQRIVDAALREKALAVVIAGDVFDSLEGYYACRQGFAAGLKRLATQGLPVMAVAGNHDWNTLPAFADAFPESGLRLLGRGGAWEEARVGEITYAGWSFPGEKAAAPPLASFSVQVGLLHCDLDDPKSSYAPVSEGGLELGRPGWAESWVLGHIHKPRASERICYPGSPQALDFGPGERGIHGFAWLNLERGKGRFGPTVPVSTVLFAEERVEPEEGEPLEAALDRTCARLKEDQPFLASVQLRARVVLDPAAVEPNRDPEMALNAADCIHVVEVSRRVALDLEAESQQSDGRGEAARLLLGVRAELGQNTPVPVQEDWRESARDLAERGARKAASLFTESLEPFVGQIESAVPRPRPGEARGQALQALEQALSGFLARSAP